MSYDLCLWKQKRGCKKPPLEIFNQLCDGKDVAEIAVIPISKLLKRLKTDVPGTEESNGKLVWEDPKWKASELEVSWSRKHLYFECFGLSVKYMRLLMAISRDFGLPVWDPQRKARYETEETGREKPPTD